MSDRRERKATPSGVFDWKRERPVRGLGWSQPAFQNIQKDILKHCWPVSEKTKNSVKKTIDKQVRQMYYIINNTSVLLEVKFLETSVDKISDTEAEIMKVVWSKGGPITYAEIRSALSMKFDMGNQSIQTLLKRLVQKKVLKQEKRDVYYYSALVLEADYVKSKTMTLLEKVFDGDAKGLLSALVSYKEVTPEDLEDLYRFWRKGREIDE